MCGIAGAVDFTRTVNKQQVQRALKQMEYRGPDNIGIFEDSFAVLGHNRLSVLDLNPRANQPFCLKMENLVIVFNGEIYNYLELKKILEKEGYRFETTSDTEVLIYGFLKWGPEIVDKLIGMFAFLIYDIKNSSLFFARDRFGEKPFLYSVDKGRFIFASNLAGLNELLDVKELNADGINELIAYQYISTNVSIYSNVNKLKPGFYGVFDKAGLKIKQYWNVNYSEKIDISLKEAADKVEELLNLAIENQINADVPVGVFLSGGNDSGIVASIASNYSSRLTSITMGLDSQPEFDETSNAKLIADRHRLDAHFIKMDDNCAEELPLLLGMGEPFADSSILPAFNVARKAKSYATVVLTGDGGDEIFGGYGKPFMALRAGYEPNSFIKQCLRYFGNRRFNPLFSRIGSYALSDSSIRYGGLELFLRMQDFGSEYIKKTIFQDSFIRKINIGQGESYLKEYHEGKDLFTDFHDALLYLGVKTRLPDDFLVKIDTSTMAASVESRAPFLDHRIIDFTSKLKPEILMPGGIYKGLLKKVAEKYLPSEIIYSPKKGFSIPVSHYFRSSWHERLNNLLIEGLSAEIGVINPQGVRKLLKWHHSQNIPQIDRLLYSIFVFELWLRIHFKNH